MRIPLAVMVALFIVTTSARAQNPADFLAASMKRIESARALGIVLDIEPDGSIVEDPSAYSIDARIVLEGDKNAYVEMKMGGQLVQMYENGTQRSYYYAHKGWHRQARSSDRSQLIAQMLADPLGSVGQWLADYLHNSESILKDASDIQFLGVESGPAGVSIGHLFCRYADYSVDVFIESKTRSLTRILFTLHDYSTPAPEEVGFRKGGKIDCVVKEWNWSERTQPELFAYQPPKVEREPREEDPPPVSPSHQIALSTVFKDQGVAPPINLSMMDGSKFSLNSYKGRKAVLLDFWASWCGQCRKTLPILDKLNSEMSLKNVAIVSINLDEDKKMAETYLDFSSIKLPVAYDAEGKAASAYNARSIPTLVVVAKSGNIILYKPGASPNFESEMRVLLTTLEQYPQ